jgi:5-methylthioadenosine/S-adenosylhomocysteine deaminase
VILILTTDNPSEERNMSEILIEGGMVLTTNDQNEIFQDGFVHIQDDRIAAIGEGRPPAEFLESSVERIDANGFVVMPGTVNGHVHLQQTLVRGLSDDQGVVPWVRNIAFPVYKNMTEDEVYTAALMGMVENIRGGATAVTDNLTVRSAPGNFDASFRAARDSGIRYKLARGFNERNVDDAFRETSEEVINDMRRLYETWHGSENGRLRLDFNPHALRLVTADTLLKIHDLARDWGIGIHLHTSESEFELDEWIEETGQRQVDWLADLEILGPHFQLAHSVWLNDREVEIIADTGAVVVHNPVSNMFTGAGVCPITDLHANGATVALGTDGQAVANGMEMMDVLKWAVNLQKAHTTNPVGIKAGEIIKMACRGGAYAFGQPELIGSLEVGKKADLILVDLHASRLTPPIPSIPSLIVNFCQARDVDTVIIDGKILMRKKEILFLDENTLIEDFTKARKSVLSRAGIASDDL